MSDPSRVRMSGPLSVFAAGFREDLRGRGYRPGTAAKQLQLMVHVSRWLAAHDLEPAALHGVEIERFVRERRASHAHLASARALEPLLGYLRGLGVVPPAGSREAPTLAGALLDRYAEYRFCPILCVWSRVTHRLLRGPERTLDDRHDPGRRAAEGRVRAQGQAVAGGQRSARRGARALGRAVLA